MAVIAGPVQPPVRWPPEGQTCGYDHDGERCGREVEFVYHYPTDPEDETYGACRRHQVLASRAAQRGRRRRLIVATLDVKIRWVD